MWLAFSDAFISAVEDRNDPTRLVVRTRSSIHLKRLFPDAEIVLTPRADYAARVYIQREELSRVLVERVSEIKYDNFKNSVDDPDLHELYSDMWSLHHAYQQKLTKPDRSRHMSWGAGDVVFHKRKE